MSHAPSPTLERRHQLIRKDIAARGLDAVVVTSLPNILYLTNFAGSSAIVVLTADRISFITDFRYQAALQEMQSTSSACPDLDLVLVEGSMTARSPGCSRRAAGGESGSKPRT